MKTIFATTMVYVLAMATSGCKTTQSASGSQLASDVIQNRVNMDEWNGSNGGFQYSWIGSTDRSYRLYASPDSHIGVLDSPSGRFNLKCRNESSYEVKCDNEDERIFFRAIRASDGVFRSNTLTMTTIISTPVQPADNRYNQAMSLMESELNSNSNMAAYFCSNPRFIVENVLSGARILDYRGGGQWGAGDQELVDRVTRDLKSRRCR